MSTSEIEQQASIWLARLDAAQPSPELIEAIRAWRAADPRHDAEFSRLQAVWGRLDGLESLRLSAATQQTHSAVAPLQTSQERAAVSASKRDWSGRAIALAASVVLAIGVIMLAPWSDRAERHVTGIGAFERVVLADGSIVELNTNSEIRVALGDELRSVELVRGEAHFTVAPDSARPFVVSAGGAAVRAVGTQFNVHRLGDQDLEVLVTEGKVTLTPTGATAETPLITAGEGGSIVHGGEVAVRRVAAAEIKRELAWKDGMLVFAGEPLQEAILEMNRYNVRQLEIDDPDVASLKIGGYFNARNLDGFIAVLNSNFGIDAVVAGDRIQLRRSVRAK
ncbi:FecR family protein [Steroidobacter sp.]|uniref:FecR family protein n=1 Tax=Steroidobacter sp. TaxID=1978227 RepID=UPI001A4D1FD1|nr:FecR domain-containing protein [Steroidobacter sp.]MBL8269295.1 FecR domain-containing protein [Steroidobacter sp.]